MTPVESSLRSTAAYCRSSRKELIMPESPGRRLPVYLLLDCSGSMSGEPIEAVRQGVRALINALKGYPMALETAYLSVITFGSTAQQICPLPELAAFKEPRLDASGATAMGDA